MRNHELIYCEKISSFQLFAFIAFGGFDLLILVKIFGGTKYFCSEFMLINFSCLYIFLCVPGKPTGQHLNDYGHLRKSCSSTCC